MNGLTRGLTEPVTSLVTYNHPPSVREGGRGLPNTLNNFTTFFSRIPQPSLHGVLFFWEYVLASQPENAFFFQHSNTHTFTDTDIVTASGWQRDFTLPLIQNRLQQIKLPAALT